MSKSKIALYLIYLGIVLFSVGIIWDIIVYILNWDIVLTPHQKLIIFWKPSLLMLLATATLNGVKKLL